MSARWKPPEALVAAFHQHHPDAIGLSGLLVKSAQQMAITAGDLREAGIQAPLLVGGAALSPRFTRGKIAPQYGRPVCYAKDAMTGLALMNGLMDPQQREAVLAANAALEEPANATAGEAGAAAAVPAPSAAPAPASTLASTAPAGEPAPETRGAPPRETRSRKVRADLSIPPLADLTRHVRDVPQLEEIWAYLNPQVLYRHHLGYKGNFEADLAARVPRALDLAEMVAGLKRQAAEFLRPRAVWQFFEAEPAGNAIRLFAPGASAPLHTFRFQRQDRTDGLCLADYVLPPRAGRRDHVAVFVVTAGGGVRQRAEAAKAAGRYVESHGLQVLALETAEAAAEWLHRRLREDWGFPDPPELTMKQRFTSRYRGKRYAFGYPACPNLDDQAGIWKLLRPEEIGVTLTDGMMMEPEASTSALVFHHPACAYFSVSDEAAGRGVMAGYAPAAAKP